MKINRSALFLIIFTFVPSFVHAGRIHRLAKKGDLPGVEAELQKWIHVNDIDRIGRTALHWAAENGHMHVVANLLQQGANPDIIDQLGDTAAELAERRGHANLARFINGEMIEEPVKQDDNEPSQEESKNSYEEFVQETLRTHPNPQGIVFFRLQEPSTETSIEDSESSSEESSSEEVYSPTFERAAFFMNQFASSGKFGF